MLVFILLYSVIFCFACFTSQTSCLCNALPSAPVVCCTLLLFLIYVSCSLPHQHRACAVLFPSAPLKFTPFIFFLCLLLSLLLLCVLCPTSSGLCSDFFPVPLEFARFIFVLYSVLIFVFCVLSLTNLIFLRFHFGCICALFGQSVRGVLFYTVYSGGISSSPVDFE